MLRLLVALRILIREAVFSVSSEDVLIIPGLMEGMSVLTIFSQYLFTILRLLDRIK